LVPSVTFDDAGAYVAMVSNRYGTLVSSTARLSVVPALRFQSFGATNRTIDLSWNAIPGNNYILQRKTNLDHAEWVDVPGAIRASDFIIVTNLLLDSAQTFYRVRLSP